MDIIYHGLKAYRYHKISKLPPLGASQVDLDVDIGLFLLARGYDKQQLFMS